jgi:ADP-heptose:LPS heptosyltransferase
MRQIVFVSANLLGDCLCTTPAVRAIRRKHPDAFITYVAQNEEHCRVLEGNPDIDCLVFSDELAAHGLEIVDESFLRSLGPHFGEPPQVYLFDVHALHRSRPDVFQDHICRGFARMTGVAIESVRPVVAISAAERSAARALMRGRTIVLGMHTTSPVVGRDRESAMKDWLYERWLALARQLHALGGFDVIAVGGPKDMAVTSRYFRNLYGLPIKVIAALLAEAACVITVESGLSHLCHAVDAPSVLIFSRDVPLVWARPEEATRCRVIYDDLRLITCERVMAAVRSVLSMDVTRWG